MPVRIVQSKENSRIKQLRRALSSPPRSAQADRGAGSPDAGLAAIEGPHLVAEAARSGVRIACIFVAQGHESLLTELELAREMETLVVPRALLDSVLATETPQPVAALIEPPVWTWDDLFKRRSQRAALIVVIAGVQDPGNLGTIVRSAEAFGASGVIALPGTVSAWNAKAVRASAGSVFRIPILAAGAADCFEHLRQAGVKVLTTAVMGAESAYRVDLTRAVAVIIGNEGNGVAAEIAAHGEGAVMIPCPGKVESLNASVAASVLLYEAARQRAADGGKV